jgi:hypothetical protein
MLTVPELTDAREKLRTALTLIDDVKSLFLGGAYIEGARMMNEITHLLADEIAALDKQIGAKP